MDKVLEIREKIKALYGRYSRIADMVLRFLLALLTFITINANIGFHKKISNPLIAIVLAFMCAFLPVNFTVMIAALLILFQLLQVSVEVALITAVVMVVMFIFYFRFTPKDGYIVLLTPVTFTLKIPYVMPLGLGLSGSPLSAVPMGCGVIIYFILHYVKVFSSTLSDKGSDAMIDKLSFLLKNIFQNQEMLLTLTAFIITLIAVYAVRRMSVDHAWKLAIGSGAILNMVILFIGDFALDIKTSFAGLIIGTIISVLISLVMEFFLFSVDYTRAEKVQFEDDEYYYYVKAVPKVSIATPEKKVQKINTQKTAKTTRRTVLSNTEEFDFRKELANEFEDDGVSEQEKEELRYLEQILKEKQEEFLNNNSRDD